MMPTAIPNRTATPLAMVVPLEVKQAAVPARAADDLEALWAADFPQYDLIAVAERYGTDAGERTVSVLPPVENEKQNFLVGDEDREITATLARITDNAYFWMGDDVTYEIADLDYIATMLEDRWYPYLTTLFGSEWRPGVDGDPHFTILHFNAGEDSTDLGYFDSTHQYPATYNPSSNQQEMLFMNMSALTLGDEEYIGTLLHELQHLIQWNQDMNEETWLDEGLGQLAEIANDFETAETEAYLADSGTSLTQWQSDEAYVYQHYAAAYLFTTYLWEQLGDEAIWELSTDLANGLASVKKIVEKADPTITIEQFLANWAVANLLDGETDDPRYGYDALWLPEADPEAYIYDIPYGVINSVAPFGVHYIDVSTTGAYTLSFAADTQTAIMPVQPFEGTDMWIAPSFDNVNAQLTRPLDLRYLADATLEFALWYDIEPDYDFGIVSISADEGATWETVPTSHVYDDALFGDAINGVSLDNDDDGDGWLHQSISLDQWIGQQIWLRFELITDWDETKVGLAIDDIRIDQLGGRLSDEEWIADGFILSGNILPQQWSVQWVQDKVVTPITLDRFNRAKFPVDISADGATIIIMPQTPFVTADATYWLAIDSE